MNKVILIGNLTKEPEDGRTPSGVSFCRLSLAVSRDYTNGDGERETDFFNITVWRKQAELCLKYLKKGNKVAVTGSLQNRIVEDGKGNRRTFTDVVATDIEFLTPKAKEETYKQEEMNETRPHLEEIDDNKLPF